MRELRKIIVIDEEACDGCGICVDACHEGAIALVDGKAKLMFENYCDGLGDCLPACPTGAITFEEREAEAYDEAAVLAAQDRQAEESASEETLSCGCPGTFAQELRESESPEQHSDREAPGSIRSELRQWPAQIKLVNPMAPYFRGGDLLIAADCSAFAYGDFHRDYMAGKITLIGCPKLDDIDYTDKLTEIIEQNTIHSVTVTRMEVPCCFGIEYAAQEAIKNSGKDVPFEVVTISTTGEIK